MDNLDFLLGVAMMIVGILMVIAQIKILKAKKTGDFTVRLLITGIGCILGGFIIIVKSL